MKKLTKLVLIGATVLVIGVTSVTAMAASGTVRGNKMANLGNKDYVSNRIINDDTEELDSLKAQCLDRMKTALDAKVAAGTMMQAQADEILKDMKERQENCTGTGNEYGMMGGQNGVGCH